MAGTYHLKLLPSRCKFFGVGGEGWARGGGADRKVGRGSDRGGGGGGGATKYESAQKVDSGGKNLPPLLPGLEPETFTS